MLSVRRRCRIAARPRLFATRARDTSHSQRIRGGANRKVLDRIKSTGDIFWAQVDRDWILDGEVVHVSRVGFGKKGKTTHVLNGKPVPCPPGQEPKVGPRLKAIADTTKSLVEQRDAWLNPPDASAAELKKRTLLSSIDSMRDDALIRLGLSVGLRVSEIVGIRTREVDFERGLIKTWDETKDKWRLIMPTNEALSAIRK